MSALTEPESRSPAPEDPWIRCVGEPSPRPAAGPLPECLRATGTPFPGSVRGRRAGSLALAAWGEMNYLRSTRLDALPSAVHGCGRNDLNRGRSAFCQRIGGIRKTHRDGVVVGHLHASHLRPKVRHEVRCVSYVRHKARCVSLTRSYETQSLLCLVSETQTALRLTYAPI